MRYSVTDVEVILLRTSTSPAHIRSEQSTVKSPVCSGKCEGDDMVSFMFIPLTEPRLSPELRAKFVHVNQLVRWELTDSSGKYTGLVVVGAQPHLKGFQARAEFTIDLPQKGLSNSKMREVSHTVETEFVNKAITIVNV